MSSFEDNPLRVVARIEEVFKQRQSGLPDVNHPLWAEDPTETESNATLD